MGNKASSSKSAKPKKRIVYWDSCVFIDAIQKQNLDRMHELGPLLKSAERDDLIVVTSALTIAEVLRGPDEEAIADPKFDHKKYVKSFLENPWIEIRATDRQVWELTAEIRRRSKIKGSGPIVGTHCSI